MIIVILAAGKGSRLKSTLPKSFPYITKSIIKINNQPAITRLIKQFSEIGCNNIILVLGHKYQSVLKVINDDKQEFVLNKYYKNDSNLRSLFLALKRIINTKIFELNNGLLVVEADSFFSNKHLKNFIDYIYKLNNHNNSLNKICWTTKGYSKIDDSGGFIEPLETNNPKNNGQVKNVYINRSPKNHKTMKMFGITWFNNSSIMHWYEKAKLFLINKDPKDLTGYFHEILFEDLKSYSMSYYDLGPQALSFNDYSEYIKCINLK